MLIGTGLMERVCSHHLLPLTKYSVTSTKNYHYLVNFLVNLDSINDDQFMQMYHTTHLLTFRFKTY